MLNIYSGIMSVRRGVRSGEGKGKVNLAAFFFLKTQTDRIFRSGQL